MKNSEFWGKLRNSEWVGTLSPVRFMVHSQLRYQWACTKMFRCASNSRTHVMGPMIFTDWLTDWLTDNLIYQNSDQTKVDQPRSNQNNPEQPKSTQINPNFLCQYSEQDFNSNWGKALHNKFKNKKICATPQKYFFKFWRSILKTSWWKEGCHQVWQVYKISV